MEAVEEPPLHNVTVEGMKVPVVYDKSDENAVASIASDVCHKSNGVTDSSEPAEIVPIETMTKSTEDGDSENITSFDVKGSGDAVDESANAATPQPDNTTDVKAVEHSECKTAEGEATVAVVPKNENIEELIGPDKIEGLDATVEVAHNNEESADRVTFQTEILVETEDNDGIETVTEETTVDNVHDTSNLLSELGQSIELSEALRSSDVTDNIENNNCATKQEVFNKEELLDILEGNDEEQPENMLPTNFENMPSEKFLETQIALQQLSRLKRSKKARKSLDRLSRSRKSDKKLNKKVKSPEENKCEESIVNVLVKEWDDEDVADDKSKKLLQETENLLQRTEEIVKSQEIITKEDEQGVARTSIDSSTEGKNPASKSGDEGQPQRRLGRVIKKKVIFDPDNPDTFTKSKTIKKEPSLEKEQTPSKKIKTDQSFQRSKSKSPMSKLQWKKPSPKTCKQNKRLSEVDKLLMDEGAVNMIYQLTPEAPKGKKNMKTKAEFIKKIQSSTPDSKEMKFRERKKESKYEEGEARKILGGKQRPSLNSSVKSPSVSEDFEAHSADDSIIYRRHSSSSYSSSCMSPRRLSDVETSNQSAPRNSQQTVEAQSQCNAEANSSHPISEVFMSESTDAISPETINKNDCLSIKEKLNSKLNLALNKRKRENSKVEKPPQLKKVKKSDEKAVVISGEFKYLSISFDQRLAKIRLLKSGSKFNIEVIKDLERAFQLVDSMKDISVTLLTSDCENTYSDLDLKPLLDDSMERTTNLAFEIAESIRSLLQIVMQHSKLLCIGISGRCSGIALALLALCEVPMCSELATFAISPKSQGSPSCIEPGLAVLTASKTLTQPFLNNLVVFGRRLSASEALQGGLVSRVLWPENFNEQVYTIAKDIASQPHQNIWLKKQLLNMKKCAKDSTFLSCLEKERDFFVEYWTSVEGQEILRVMYNA